MSLRATLARNLRSLCGSVGSINAACREMKIHRQQFEKYLSQESMPTAKTVQKICLYFEISETDLFSPDIRSLAQRKKRTKRAPPFGELCATAMRPLWSEPAPSLKPGIYFLWMTVPDKPDHFMCAPVFVEKIGEALTFRRIVGAAEPSDSLWWHGIGDHKGVVVERLSWLMLVGVNQRGNLEPSMIRLKWVPLSQLILGGHATITTPSGISFAAACLRPAQAGTTVRKALRQSRMYASHDACVDGVTRVVLEKQRQELAKIVASDLSL